MKNAKHSCCLVNVDQHSCFGKWRGWFISTEVNSYPPMHACMGAELLQSCPTLCDPVDCARLLCPRDSPGKSTGVDPGDLPDSGIKPASLTPPALAGRFFITSTTSVSFFTLIPDSTLIISVKKKLVSGHTLWFTSWDEPVFPIFLNWKQISVTVAGPKQVT